MVNIKIEASNLTAEEIQELEKEANNLITEHNYSLHSVLHHFGMYKQLSVSLYAIDKDTAVINCIKNAVKHA